MKASTVNVRAFNSAADCWKAIEQIENDSQNIIGGTSAWLSGKQTFLTEAAKKKIAALENRAYSFTEGEE